MNLIITWESGPAVCSICGKIPCKHFKIIESQDVNAMQSFNEFGTPLYHEEFGPNHPDKKEDRMDFEKIKIPKAEGYFGAGIYEEFGREQVKHEHEMKLKQTKEEYERHHGRL